jgi:hypothetical protein
MLAAPNAGFSPHIYSQHLLCNKIPPHLFGVDVEVKRAQGVGGVQGWLKGHHHSIKYLHEKHEKRSNINNKFLHTRIALNISSLQRVI